MGRNGAEWVSQTVKHSRHKRILKRASGAGENVTGPLVNAPREKSSLFLQDESDSSVENRVSAVNEIASIGTIPAEDSQFVN